MGSSSKPKAPGRPAAVPEEYTEDQLRAERDRKRLEGRNSTQRASLVAGVEESRLFSDTLLGEPAEAPGMQLKKQTTLG